MIPSLSSQSRTCLLGTTLLLMTQVLIGWAGEPAVGQAPTGTITGVVTDNALTPLESVSVQIMDAAGNQVAFPATGADGHFSADSLPPGTYYARTFNSAGYIDELFDGVAPRSGFSAGTPIIVTDGGTANLVFRLEQGGRVAGQITNAATTAPIAGVWVDVFDDTGRHVGSTPQTDATGTHITPFGLPAGTYYLQTNNNGSWVNELYADHKTFDRVLDGTPVAVTLGVTTNGINFALDEGGRVAGLATGPGDVPLANVGMAVLDASGRWRAGANTGADGTYTTGVVPTGTYYVTAWDGTGHILEIYNNVICYGCGATGGTPVAVTGGATTPGINFELALGGRIAGRITDTGTGTGVAGVWVDIHDATGRHIGSTPQSDASGDYITAFGLPAGTYYAKTNSNTTYVNEAHNGLPVSTPSSSWTPIVVTGANTTSGINFVLAAGGQIEGTVTDAASGNPLAWHGSVTVYDSQGTWMTGTGLDVSGHYVTTGLPAGNYFVVAYSDAGHIAQIFDGVTCLSCGITGGTPVTITVGAKTSGIDFALVRGGTIAGRITDAAGGAGIPAAWVNIYDASGRHLGGTPWTDASGEYKTRFGLPTGTYYADATNNGAFISEAYDNLPLSTNVPNRTPIPVVAGAATTGIDFQLGVGGRISGQIVDASTLAPLQNVNISFFDAAGNRVSGANTDAAGHYLSPGLPAGAYFARAEQSGAYIQTLYPAMACLYCDVRAGTTIPVTLGATTGDINFALVQGGQIAGHITDAVTTTPLANVNVQVADSTGQFVGGWEQASDATGAYLTRGLPAGTYYIRTEGSHAYVNEFYNNLPYGMPPTSATPVVVSLGSVTQHIDFPLATGGRISGRIVDASTLMPLQNVSVSIFDGSGSFAGNSSTDATGHYLSPGLPAGTYFAKTDRSGAYIQTLYQTSACLRCDVKLGTPIPVTGGTTTAGINFSLVQGGRIAGHVTSAATAAPVANVAMEVADSTGNFIWGWEQGTDATGAYLTVGLPAGTYYIRTNGSHPYVNELYDNLPYGGNVTSATPVVVSLGSTIGNIDFQLGTGGFISGVVTNSAGDPVSGSNLSFFDSSGQYAGGAQSNAAGTYLSAALAAGSYYVQADGSGPNVATVYPGIPCLNCSRTTGTAVSVSPGATTGGINITLVRGGQIAGHIRNAASSAPLANVQIQLWDSAGNGIGGWEQGSDATGAYLTRGLPAGTYYIRTEGTHAYVNEFYDNLSYGTNVTSTTPVTVTLGQVTQNIDFALAGGGFIAGRVADATSNPLGGAGIYFYDSAGQYMGQTQASPSGTYASPALAEGSYFVEARGLSPYIQTLYPDIACLNCSRTTGTAVSVTAGATTSNINFSLNRGGQIAGHIRDAATSLPLANVFVEISDASGRNISGWENLSDATGAYVSRGLPAGTYYIRTNGTHAYANELYDNMPWGVTSSTGTPVVVTLGSVTANIDFGLNAGGFIAGRITEAATGNPVSGVVLSVFNGSGQNVGYGQTDASGNYVSSGLAAGTYYVRTNNYLGYVQQLYNNIPCTSCSTNTGTPVTVTVGATTPSINFALAQGGRIAGHVTDAATASSLSNVSIQFFNGSGQYLGSASTDAQGNYLSLGLSTGTYYVRTSNTPAYILQLYNNTACLNCSVTTGAPVAVTAGATTSGIDFALAQGGRIAGRITDAVSGAGLAGRG